MTKYVIEKKLQAKIKILLESVNQPPIDLSDKKIKIYEKGKLYAYQDVIKMMGVNN